MSNISLTNDNNNKSDKYIKCIIWFDFNKLYHRKVGKIIYIVN